MPLLISSEDDKGEIFCPFTSFAKTTCEEHAYIGDIRPYSGKFPHISKVVSQILEEWKLSSGNIGLEYKYVSTFFGDLIREKTSMAAFKDCSDLVERIRMVKSEEEKVYCIKACEITNKVLESAEDFLRAGKTEMDIAREITRRLIEYGADGASFHPQVFSGVRGLLASITSSRDKKIQNGDVVLLDFGAAYNGYRCDTTRPFVIGRSTKEQREVAEAIRCIIEGTVKSIHPGIKASDVHDAAVSKFSEQGYPCFEDGTGHGMGLQTWELPFLTSAGQIVLRPNMFLAIEHTIHKSTYGMRFEENIFVTETGCVDYIKFPMELVEV
jgi:Xaa-Pro aminopeptidase